VQTAKLCGYSSADPIPLLFPKSLFHSLHNDVTIKLVNYLLFCLPSSILSVGLPLYFVEHLNVNIIFLKTNSKTEWMKLG